MADIAKRIVIALAIGLLIGAISGAIIQRKVFYYESEVITEMYYKQNLSDSGWKYSVEKTFNRPLALLAGTIGVSTSLLFLFVPGILKKGKQA